MAHELDMTTGRPAIAYVGETPWHGLGSVLTDGAPLETWQQEAGLDWEAKLATVRFDRQIIDYDGTTKHLLTDKRDSRVIYRSDTGDALGVVSDRYRPVQPKEVIEFYRDLTERYGFQLETAGALKGGKRVWALANTNHAVGLRDNDQVKGYLLLATSFDGSMGTQAKFTSVRVVCNNTLSLVDRERGGVSVSHSTTFNADQVKLDLGIGDAFANFSERARAMTERVVSRDEATRYMLDVYYNLTSLEEIREHNADEKRAAATKKTLERLSDALFNAPGAALNSARGTLWGILNAVTYDVDHVKPARSQENRLDSAWFGPGEALKNKAWQRAVEML